MQQMENISSVTNQDTEQNQQTSNNGSSASSIKSYGFNVVKKWVTPKQALTDDINCNSWGFINNILNKHLQICTIHVGPDDTVSISNKHKAERSENYT